MSRGTSHGFAILDGLVAETRPLAGPRNDDPPLTRAGVPPFPHSTGCAAGDMGDSWTGDIGNTLSPDMRAQASAPRSRRSEAKPSGGGL